MLMLTGHDDQLETHYVGRSSSRNYFATVERGESIAITRNGKKVAALVPVEDYDREERRKAMDRFMEMRSKWKPTGMSREEILAARHVGHRL